LAAFAPVLEAHSGVQAGEGAWAHNKAGSAQHATLV
jgi:hypothetical protein